MEAKDRIIVALDVNEPLEAKKLVGSLVEVVGCFKLGLEFIYATLASLIAVKPTYEVTTNLGQVLGLFDILNGNLFWDGKLNDIPNTIAAAAKQTAKIGVRMFNAHCLSGPAAMQAARKAADDYFNNSRASLPSIAVQRPWVLGVTVLTSLSYGDLIEMGIVQPLGHLLRDEDRKQEERNRLERLVVTLAVLAKECGLDGVICSPQEIAAVRRACGPEFKIVTPGVRPEWAAVNDQKRVMTPKEAIAAGADMLVIGRPITNPPKEISSPMEAAIRIAVEIEEGLALRGR